MFTAASFVTSKTGDNPSVHSIREREIVMLPYNGILLSNKKG